MEHDPGSPLSLDAERMRRLGYRTVDMLVERLAGDPGAGVRSAALELVVLDWIREWIGYPRDARGVLTSGGSASNLTAMACAREALLGPMDASAIAYLSDQAHASLAKGARALGFRPDQVRVLASDLAGRLRVDALQAAVAADLEAGRRPLMVVA